MYNQGDVVLIPVPFSDLKQHKQRPVLIISTDNYNQSNEDIVVVEITSKLKRLDYSIIIEPKDLIEGVLKLISEIRVDKIYTLSKSIVRKGFGKVDAEILEDVRRKVNYLMR